VIARVTFLAALLSLSAGADPFRHLFDPWTDLGDPKTVAAGRPSQPLDRRTRWRYYKAWRDDLDRLRKLERAALGCPASDRDILAEVIRRTEAQSQRFERECLAEAGPNTCIDDDFRLAEFERALEDFESMVGACPVILPRPVLYPKGLRVSGGPLAAVAVQGRDARPSYGLSADTRWSGRFGKDSSFSGVLEAEGAYLREEIVSQTPYRVRASGGWAGRAQEIVSLGVRAQRSDQSFPSATGPWPQVLDEFGADVAFHQPAWMGLDSQYGFTQRTSSGDDYSGLRHEASVRVVDRVRFDGQVFTAKAGALIPNWRALRFAVVAGTDHDDWRSEFGAEERRSEGGSFLALHPSCFVSYRARPFRGAAWGTSSLLGSPLSSGQLTLSLRPEDNLWSVGGLVFRVGADWRLEWDQWRLDLEMGTFFQRHRGGPGPEAWESGFLAGIKPTWHVGPRWRLNGDVGFRRSSLSLVGVDPRLWTDRFGSTRLHAGVGLAYVFER